MPYKDPLKKKEANRRWFVTNREKAYAQNEQWNKNHPEKRKEIVKKSQKRRKRNYREVDLKKNYGWTEAIFDAFFINQGSCCASCKRTDPCSKRGWMVDHDHNKKKGDNGFIRGILCHPCNQAANKHHTPTSLRQLADYMEKHDAIVP